MRQQYKDILDRIAEPPAWFDDFGVPRFGNFSPRQLGNIYAREAALAEVSCQACGRMFKVALTDASSVRRFSLSDEIRLGRVGYGDPPNVNCCLAGASTSSVMHKILEYWSREGSRDWQRDLTFEGPVTDAPKDPPDTVAEVLAAIVSGNRTVLVNCTSQRNLYDLAGRITAALARAGRVLVTHCEGYGVVAHKMLSGLILDMDIGTWKDDRVITITDFSCFKNVHIAMIDSIIVLAGPLPRTGATQDIWNDVASRLATEAVDKTRIELALAQSCCMIDSPALVVDAGRIENLGGEGGLSE